MLSIPARTTAGTPGKTLGCTLKMVTAACQIATRATRGARNVTVPNKRPTPAEAVRAEDVKTGPCVRSTNATRPFRGASHATILAGECK